MASVHFADGRTLAVTQSAQEIVDTITAAPPLSRATWVQLQQSTGDERPIWVNMTAALWIR